MGDAYAEALALVAEGMPPGQLGGMVCNICDEWAMPIAMEGGDLIDESFVKMMFLLHLNLKHPMEAFKNGIGMDVEQTVAMLENTFNVLFGHTELTWEFCTKLATTGTGMRVVGDA